MVDFTNHFPLEKEFVLSDNYNFQNGTSDGKHEWHGT